METLEYIIKLESIILNQYKQLFYISETLVENSKEHIDNITCIQHIRKVLCDNELDMNDRFIIQDIRSK